jgi:uncharacterized protein (DUF1697 family)
MYLATLRSVLAGVALIGTTVTAWAETSAVQNFATAVNSGNVASTQARYIFTVVDGKIDSWRMTGR